MKFKDQNLGIQANFEAEGVVGISSRPGDVAVWTSMLINQKYTDGIRACAREIISNAVDAQKLNGDPRPIEIELPTALNPLWRFTDHGPGMGPDFLQNEYLWLGRSDKKDSDALIGGFGLGSKTPLTFTNSYTLRSRVYDPETDTCTQYGLILSKNDMGSISHASLEPVEGFPADSHGVTIEVAVDEQQVAKIRKEVFNRTFLNPESFRVTEGGEELFLKNRTACCKIYEDENGSVYYTSTTSARFPTYEASPRRLGINYAGVFYSLEHSEQTSIIERFRERVSSRREPGHRLSEIAAAFRIEASTSGSFTEPKAITFIPRMETHELGIVDSRDNIRFEPGQIEAVAERLSALTEGYMTWLVGYISSLDKFDHAFTMSSEMGFGDNKVYKGRTHYVCSAPNSCYEQEVVKPRSCKINPGRLAILLSAPLVIGCVKATYATKIPKEGRASVTRKDIRVRDLIRAETIVITNRSTYSIRELRNAAPQLFNIHQALKLKESSPSVLIFEIEREDLGSFISQIQQYVAPDVFRCNKTSIIRDFMQKKSAPAKKALRPLRIEQEPTPHLYTTPSFSCLLQAKLDGGALSWQCVTGKIAPGVALKSDSIPSTLLGAITRRVNLPFYYLRADWAWAVSAFNEASRFAGWTTLEKVKRIARSRFLKEYPEWKDPIVPALVAYAEESQILALKLAVVVDHCSSLVQPLTPRILRALRIQHRLNQRGCQPSSERSDAMALLHYQDLFGQLDGVIQDALAANVRDVNSWRWAALKLVDCHFPDYGSPGQLQLVWALIRGAEEPRTLQQVVDELLSGFEENS